MLKSRTLVCLLSLLTVSSALSPSSSFLQQQTGAQQIGATSVNGVLIEDVDDFAQWAFTYAGLDFDDKNEFIVRTSPQEDVYVDNQWVNGRVTLLDQDEVNDSENPSLARYQSFIDVSPQQNPFGRDVDELPDNPDDEGKDHRKGKTNFVLVTAFDPDVPGSGEVWVIPQGSKNRDNSFVLVGGLQTPTGVCFDKNHDFLYVCDPAQGSIFQYEIDSSGRNRFVLGSDQVATVYQGIAPTACAVDAYSNLYFTEQGSNSIEIIDYLNLWSGFVNQNTTLYQRTENMTSISQPVGIDVYNSDTIYWVNSADQQNSGLICSAPSRTRGLNLEAVTVDLRDVMTPYDLAVSEKFVYFSNTDGSVWAYDFKGTPNLYLKSSSFFRDPRGVCYGNNRIYVADYGRGRIYSFKDDKEENVSPERFARLTNAYGLACINR